LSFLFVVVGVVCFASSFPIDVFLVLRASVVVCERLNNGILLCLFWDACVLKKLRRKKKIYYNLLRRSTSEERLRARNSDKLQMQEKVLRKEALLIVSLLNLNTFKLQGQDTLLRDSGLFDTTVW